MLTHIVNFTLLPSHQVVSGPALGLDDFSPTQGQLEFTDQQQSQFIVLSVLPDDIPENNEVFTIKLVSPTGGASLAATNTEAQLIISSNDSPVRFSDAMVEVEEDAGRVVLTLFRGLLTNGIQVGPLDTVTRVQYSTSSGTATAGVDYQTSSGTVVFNVGSAQQQINIPIINDTIPEGDEFFTVSLSSPSTDAVLVNPLSSTVTIAVNDNAGGVIRFKSTDPVIISEDDATVASLIIERTVGTVQDVAIAWSIQDSEANLATADFNPASGTVTIPNGQANATLMVQALNDNIAEEAELFMVSIDAVVGGNGELDVQTLRVTPLYVADSDDVYGLVQLAPEDTSIAVSGVSPLYWSLYLSYSCSPSVSERSPVSSDTYWRDYWTDYSGLQHCLLASRHIRPRHGSDRGCGSRWWECRNGCRPVAG